LVGVPIITGAVGLTVQLYATLLDTVLPQLSVAVIVKTFVSRQPLVVSTLVALNGTLPQLLLALIPLSTLARLEEFPVAQVEMSGNQWVTQYRGQILPLIRLNVVLEERRNKLRALQAPPAADSGPIQVLVLNHDGKSFGLVVERILDIVEDRADVKSAATRASVLYSVVIGDRVTELLDIPAILRSAEGNAARPGLATRSAEFVN